MDYNTLTSEKAIPGSIKYWGQHELIDAVGCLEQGQAWIFEQLRSREMRTLAANIALATDAYTIPLATITGGAASDFMDPVWFQFRDDTEPLPYVHEGILGRFINTGDIGPPQGRPQRYAIFGEAIQFDWRADQGYTADCLYYGRPAPLGPSNQTNFLTVRFPLLLRRICTALAYEDRKRDASQMYALADESLMQANIAEDMNRRGQILR